jgi:hypothetical protein
MRRTTFLGLVLVAVIACTWTSRANCTPVFESEYIAVADDAFEGYVEDLCQLLGGMKVHSRQVVFVSEVDSEFGNSDGALTEAEMQAFADYLMAPSGHMSPRYLVLIGTNQVIPGKSLYNPSSAWYAPYPHFGSDLVSDSAYFNDGNRVPVIKVGRLPFESGEEVEAYAARLSTYLGISPQYRTYIDQFVGNIQTGSDRVDGAYGAWTVEPFVNAFPEVGTSHLAADVPDQYARSTEFQSVLTRGYGVLLALGQNHSPASTADWIYESDVSEMSSSKPGVCFLITCNSHAPRSLGPGAGYTYKVSNGQILLQNGLAIASAGMSHYVDPSTAIVLYGDICASLASGVGELGAIVNHAIATAAAAGGTQAVVAQSLTVFGDPAMEIGGWGCASRPQTIGFESLEADSPYLVYRNDLGAFVKREYFPYSNGSGISGFGNVGCRVSATGLSTSAGEIEVGLRKNLNHVIRGDDKLSYYLFVEDTAGMVYLRLYSGGVPIVLNDPGSDLQGNAHQGGWQALNPGWNYAECDLSEVAGLAIDEVRLVMQKPASLGSSASFVVTVDGISFESLGDPQSPMASVDLDDNGDKMPDGWWASPYWGINTAVDVADGFGENFTAAARIRINGNNGGTSGLAVISRTIVVDPAATGLAVSMRMASADNARVFMLLYDRTTGQCVASHVALVAPSFETHSVGLSFGGQVANSGRYEVVVGLAAGGSMGSYLWMDGLSIDVAGVTQSSRPPVDDDVASVAMGTISAAPNPFNPKTTIRFGSPLSGWGDLSVYDVRGRLVASLYSGRIEAGRPESVLWNGRGRNGEGMSAGVYLLRLTVDGVTSSTSKVHLLK